ncbi:MAG TPA: hypothetical protein VNQ76_09270 [Planctomicrobium sp.]|nr:hypothetical protein [Planctomicrobium sp.]
MTYRNTPFAQSLLVRRRALNALKGCPLIFCTDTAEIEVFGRPGKTVFRQTDYQGVQIVESRRDFLIECHLLIDPFSDQVFRPLDGHRIKEPIGDGQFNVYVIRPVGSEPAVRHSDTTETEWRIHTLLFE